MITLEEYKSLGREQRNQVNRLRKSMGLKSYNALKGEPSPHKGKASPLKGRKLGPSGSAGKPKPWLLGEKPERWISGPDPKRHRLYTPWLNARAQANYRQEGWVMTFDEFAEMWGDNWDLRGRDGPDLCMCRIDSEKPWSRDNCEIVTRKEVNQRAGSIKRRQALKMGRM
jgi:hypothetical protein